jgi:hypothetical protein
LEACENCRSGDANASPYYALVAAKNLWYWEASGARIALKYSSLSNANVSPTEDFAIRFDPFKQEHRRQAHA